MCDNLRSSTPPFSIHHRIIPNLESPYVKYKCHYKSLTIDNPLDLDQLRIKTKPIITCLATKKKQRKSKRKEVTNTSAIEHNKAVRHTYKTSAFLDLAKENTHFFSSPNTTMEKLDHIYTAVELLNDPRALTAPALNTIW